MTAARTSLPVSAIRAALERPASLGAQTEIRNELAVGIPVGRRDWVGGLMAYLADCTSEEADELLHAMRTAKTKLDGIR